MSKTSLLRFTQVTQKESLREKKIRGKIQFNFDNEFG